MEIKIGSVVRFTNQEMSATDINNVKSERRQLTVTHTSEKEIECMWYDGILHEYKIHQFFSGLLAVDRNCLYNDCKYKDCNLKVGKVVQLKSGSPQMTVIHVSERKITCMWQDKESHEYKSSQFLSGLLAVDISCPYNDCNESNESNESNDCNLKVGKVVQLKSGSTQMTVTHVSEGRIICMWQDKESHEYKSSQFLAECLIYMNYTDNDYDPKVGDAVQLKSGGLKMWVAHINDDKTINCMWFNENKGNYEDVILPRESIEIVKKNIIGHGPYIIDK